MNSHKSYESRCNIIFLIIKACEGDCNCFFSSADLYVYLVKDLRLRGSCAISHDQKQKKKIIKHKPWIIASISSRHKKDVKTRKCLNDYWVMCTAHYGKKP